MKRNLERKGRAFPDHRLWILIGLFVICELLGGAYFKAKPEEQCTVLRCLNGKLVIVDCNSAVHQPASSVPPHLSPFFFRKIPVNRADREMLESVAGIGPSLAEKIIAYRRTAGRITSADELCRIDGIGKQRSEKLSQYLSFTE